MARLLSSTRFVVSQHINVTIRCQGSRLLTTVGRPTGTNNTFFNRVKYSVSNTRFYKLSKNKWFRRCLRTTRVVVLCVTLYQLGRTSGIHDFVRDPSKHTTEFIMGALQSMEAKAVEICTGESRTKTKYVNFELRKTAERLRSAEMVMIRKIGERLVHAAHDHVLDHMMFQPIDNEEIGAEIKISLDEGHHWIPGKFVQVIHPKSNQKDKKVNNDMKKEYKVLIDGTDEPVIVKRKNFMTEEDEKLDESRRILEKRWTFLLYESPHPNAFVTGLLPNHVFVSTSLVHKNICSCEDELAMVMGHELAHTVLDHCHADFDGMIWSTIASTVLISLLDPTGFGSFLYEMFGIGMLSTYAYVLPAKRCHEAEADQLGLIFAAKACFKPDKAIKFFQKLKKLEDGFRGKDLADEVELDIEKSSISKTIRGWTSDHPLTEERIILLQESVGNANKLYEEQIKATNIKESNKGFFSYFQK